MQISNLSEMAVQVEMNDIEVVKFTIGDLMPVTFLALPDVEVEGRVLNILPNEGNTERPLIVLVGLETIPEGLRWGMTAEVIIPSE